MSPMMMGGPGGPRGGRPGGPGGPGSRKTVRENPNSVQITKDNATFLMKNGFLFMACPKDAEPRRVLLHRDFPFDHPWSYISVLSTDNTELAFLQNIDLFEGEEKEIIVRELERKYYTPAIKKILSVKDRFGFSYWDVETDSGKVTFTLQDTFKSISRAGDHKLFFSDVDGNRFVIENIEALDRKSHKKIELYL
ncbi:MAG: DUF1854 domain-containing protein [Clostridia bacterium]|nr:DUF1854 domain-containing protein [Clostridia bacterium]